ncbi:MAG: hypothetical protein V2I35_03870 [Desulfocapsaceae bacterium]|nr:hypothetical protein [Desulfocapsaceae bacterium]
MNDFLCKNKMGKKKIFRCLQTPGRKDLVVAGNSWARWGRKSEEKL